jgi:hypothetical protein
MSGNRLNVSGDASARRGVKSGDGQNNGRAFGHIGNLSETAIDSKTQLGDWRGLGWPFGRVIITVFGHLQISRQNHMKKLPVNH